MATTTSWIRRLMPTTRSMNSRGFRNPATVVSNLEERWAVPSGTIDCSIVANYEGQVRNEPLTVNDAPARDWTSAKLLYA